MKWQIRRCVRCLEYTLKDICPKCKVETVIPIPSKFSPTDRYARYRVQKLRRHEDLNNRIEDQTQ